MRRLPLYIVSALIFAASSSPAHGLNIYCEDDPPFQLQTPDGKLGGMVVEFVTEIQRRVGNTDPIQMVPWSRGLAYLDSQPDTLLFSMSRTAERSELYQWIGPIAETAYTFYAKADSRIAINTLDDARKVGTIGVYRDDIRDTYLTKAGFTNLDRVRDNSMNIKLMAGRLAVYASSPNNIKADVERAGFKLADAKPVYVFLRSQVYITASKKTDTGTVAKWNGALDAMKKDGALKKIFRKYYPDLPLPGPAITKF